MMLEHGTPTVSVEIEGVSRRLIVDTGSNVSILQPGVSKSDVRVTTVRPFGVTGESLDIKGHQSVSLRWNGCEMKHSFLVCLLPTDAAGLVGADFMEKTGATINFECSKVTLTSTNQAPQAHIATPTGQLALTVFPGSKDGRNPQTSKREAWRMDEQVPVSPRPEVNNQQCKSWLVKAAENITVAPKCRQIVMGRLELEEEQELPPLVLVEPAQVPIEGILPARGLSRVGLSVQTPRSMTSQDDHTAVTARSVHVMVANFSTQELTIPKTSVLGIAEEVAESVVDKINAGSDDDASKPKTLGKRKRTLF